MKLIPIHHIRNILCGPIFFSPGESHTKGFLVLLYLSLEGATKIDTDPKGSFVSFKVTQANDSIREQLARGGFFEGLKSYMENENEGNEIKIILE